MTLQDGKQDMRISDEDSLHQLFRSMQDVLNVSPKKDKIFIKNELKIKPLIEVGKHSLNDECSPLAIVNLKLIQAAFEHFGETSKDDLQPFSKDNNQWKDCYFISHGDSKADVVSDESDLEKALNELQMSEISNNISDPEVLNFCNKQLLDNSFADSLYANEPGELSPYHPLPLLDLTPTKSVVDDVPFILVAPNPNEICDNLMPETFNLSLIVDQKLKISKPVKRKKSVFGKRKKCKKKSLLSINVPKSVLVRNVNSTDSSEIGSMSETQENNHARDDKDLFTTEELKQSEVVVKTHCIKSKKKLKKNLKKIVKVKITRPPKDRDKSQEKLKMISKVQNSTIPLQMSQVEDCDKTTNNVIKGPETVLQALTPFQISEQLSGKNSQILNKTDTQTQIHINSSQVLKQVNKNTCESSDKSPKTVLQAQISEQQSGKNSQILNKTVPQTQSPVNSSQVLKQVNTNTCESSDKSPKTVLQTQISEQQSGKNSQILNKTVSQTQSPVNSSQVLKQVNKSTCESSDKSPKTDLLPQSITEMLGKLVSSPKNILQPKSPVIKSTSKGELHKDVNDTNKDLTNLKEDSIQFDTVNSLQNHDSDFAGCEKDKDSFITNPVQDESNSNRNINIGSSFAEDKCSVKTQSVLSHHSQSQKESTDLDIASLNVEFPKQKIPEKVVEQSRGDEDVLDYEYSPLSDLSESESLCPVNDNQDSFLEDEEMHSQDGSDDATDNYDTEVGSKTSSVASSSQTNETPPKDNHITGSSNYNGTSEDMALPLANGEVNVSKDVDMRLQWVPIKKERDKKRPAAFSDDEDSNSDSEHSFKRRNNNSSPPQHVYRNTDKEQVPSSSSTKLDMVPEQHFEKLDYVMEHIRSLCANHKIMEAVDTTNRYLEISNSRSVCLEIFEEIILGINISVCTTGFVPEDPLREIFDKLKAFVGNPDAQKRDWRFCSKVICKYLQHSLLIEFALDLCTFCQIKGISISSQAIEAYTNNAMSSKAPTPILIKFLDYVKRVCKLSFPKSLLRHVLERVTKGKECYLLPDFSQLCNLLCKLEAYELGKQPLQKFIEICVENDCWEQIARFFIAWAAKGHFPGVLLQVLRSKLDDSAMLFKKLAAEVFGSGEQDAQCTTFFGLTGIILMLESYYKGLEEKNPKNICILNASDVLYTLHKYEVNCFDLGESLCNAEWIHKKESADPDPATVIFFPYNVIFTAVEICLHLEKPKNAFLVFRNYSPKLHEVPNALKSSIRGKHFELLLEVTRLLQQSDPLDTGLSAFQELMSTLEKGTFLEDLKSADVNMSAIANIYNSLLVTHMNKSLVSNVYDLYQYTRGPCEALLRIETQVLRGLVVTFVKNQRMDEAHTLFALGCHQKIYQFEKPQPEELPFKVTLTSNLTSQEMMLVIEKFLKMMSPILSSDKPKNTHFEDWFALKIAFKELPCIPSKINCLIEPPSLNALKRARSILRLIYSDFIWTENDDYILLSHDTVYSYWYKNYAAIQDKSFCVIQSRPLAFGLDSDSATGNLSETPDPNKTIPNDNPATPQVPEEVSSTTSDHGHSLNRTISFEDTNNPAKRRISFSSSERSSSHTPESRLSSDRESRPLQRETIPFLSGSICKSSNDCLNEAHEQRRTASIDMSQLSNLICKKISPLLNPPLFTPQSPVISHQSPILSRQSPVISRQSPQTQSRVLPVKRSSGAFQSLKQKDFSSVSPKAFQSPKQHASENTSLGSSNYSPKFQAPKQLSRENTSLGSCNYSPKFQPPKQNVSENMSLGSSNYSPKCQPPKQRVSENISSWMSNYEQSSDTSAMGTINECQNLSSRSSLLISPPKNSFGNASLSVSDRTSPTKPEIPRSTVRNLNLSSQGGRAFEDFKITTCSSGHSRFAKQPRAIKVKKCKKSKTITSQKSNSGNTTTHKDCNPITTHKDCKPTTTHKDCKLTTTHKACKPTTTHKKCNPTTSNKTAIPIQHSSAVQSSFAECVSPSSSPELSHYQEPPSSPELSPPSPEPPIALSRPLKAKRRLIMRREAEPPKLPPYRIPTPCKQLRVIRPVTPIVKSSGFRCITPLSFQSSAGASQNYRRPITFSSRASNKNWGVVHKKIPEFKHPEMQFQKLTVSLQSSSAARVIRTSPSLNSTGLMFKNKNVVQESCNNDVPKDVFDKVVTFLQSKVLLKFRNIDTNQLLDKTTTLANTFINNNSVRSLDSKSKKLLFEFAKNIE